MSETITHLGSESCGNPEVAEIEVAREKLLKMEKASREGDVIYTDFGDLILDPRNQRYLEERCLPTGDELQPGAMLGLPNGLGFERITVVKDKENDLATDPDGRLMFNFFHGHPRTDVGVTKDGRFLAQTSNFRNFMRTEGEWRTLVMASPEEMARFEVTILPNPRT